MKRFYALLMVLVSICWVTVAVQADDTRRIEGQTGIDREHGFSITLSEGWQFDPIPAIHPCFSFTHVGDPNRRGGGISTSKRLENKTARQELDEWLATAQDLMIPGEPYEVSPIVQTWLGGEEAVSCIEVVEASQGVVTTASIFAVKGDNSYHLWVSSPADQYDALLVDIENIRKNIQFL